LPESSFPLVTWVAAFIVANVLFANLAWYLFLRHPDRSITTLRHPFWRAYAPLMRALWYIGVPYAALVSGLATPEQFGLAQIDWREAAAGTAPVVFAAFFVGALLLLTLSLRARRHGNRATFPAVQSRALLSRSWGFSFFLIEALCLQAQWMFYRAAVLDYAGDARTAAGGALALAIAGWALDPRWRSELGRSGVAEDHYLVAALALVSAVLYLAVPNFWVLLATHVLLWFGWLGLLLWLSKPARQARGDLAAKED
jgi:hypothetical protein